MKLLSFDVGIKNLAYCILENKKIIKWDVVNLLEEEECDYCNIMATFKSIISDTTNYYCNKHKNQFEDIKFKLNNDNTCELCNKVSKYRYQNHYFCGIHRNTFLKSTQLIDLTKCKHLSIYDMRLRIITKLDELDLLNCETVLIESQPVMKNPIMKAIADTIYSYFLINKRDNIILKYITATNKLKIVKDSKELLKKCEQKNKYKLRKELSIKYCNDYIQKNERNYIEYFESNKKKQDDLSDCLLQALYYLQK